MNDQQEQIPAAHLDERARPLSVDALHTDATRRPSADARHEFHAIAPSEAAAFLVVSLDGLSAHEATSRQERFGLNELRRAAPPAKWKLLLEQFSSPVVWLLIAAALISALLGEWIDSAAIVAIVLVNGLLGFWQEEKSRQSLESLQSLAAPSARVVRDGVVAIVAARDLVPGDCIQLESGDQVPADARLVSTVKLGAQEAALTGESSVVAKDARAVLDAKTPLAERRNMVFSGTSIAFGRASALVVATGMNTELGRIAGMLERHTPEPTPLERRMEELGKVMMIVCVLLVAIIFALEAWRGGQLLDVFMSAVSLAVAAVPEGLPAVVTTALALGLNRMVKRHALVRRLSSVETLGSVTAICSDKTGTLTRNEMTVVEVIAGEARYRVTGTGFQPRGEFLKSPLASNPALLTDFARPIDVEQETELSDLVQAAACCTTASITPAGEERPWTVVGDPMEGALLILAVKAGINSSALRPPVVHEIPFEPERRAMSVVVSTLDGQRMFTKGAPEVVLASSIHELVDGQARVLSDDRRTSLLDSAREMASRALRVLAVARRDFPAKYSDDYTESQLTFLGLVGLQDPPREEAKIAVERCRRAGIRPIMITGDHPGTAAAIARQLGLSSEHEVVTGHELDGMSDAELTSHASSIMVYARTTAEHKQRIVESLKRRGEIVAMTGDGVNDAPAVAAADIGIAMGVTGTDVTKSASDMILTDDNFASIVDAVEEGRAIFDNIQRVVLYLLSCNAGEVILMFGAALAGWPIPLLPIQLLWINLITDGLPALTLGMEPPGPNIMDRPPRPPREPVITRARGARIMVYGTLFAISMAIGFAYVWRTPGSSVESARTVAFCIACYSQIFFAFACRNERLLFPQLGVFSNVAMFAAILVSGVLQLGTILLPIAQRVFSTTAPTADQWIVILALSLIPVTILELSKLIGRARASHESPQILKRA
jgi:Ca2+-transporting ATPase